MNALNEQVGGGHYKKLKIQPAEYVHANQIPYLEGSIIYYISRWRDKGGIEDLKKVIHTTQLLIDLEAKYNPTQPDFKGWSVKEIKAWMEKKHIVSEPNRG